MSVFGWHPFKTAPSPLNHSGNPAANGEPDRGANRIPPAGAYVLAGRGDYLRRTVTSPGGDPTAIRAFLRKLARGEEEATVLVLGGSETAGSDCFQVRRGRFPWPPPSDTGCLPLNYSGNPGANGESYRGVN